ncbi:MAG: hypothetical protein SGPRY_008589 [Prymnesium sp.]
MAVGRRLFLAALLAWMAPLPSSAQPDSSEGVARPQTQAEEKHVGLCVRNERRWGGGGALGVRSLLPRTVMHPSLKPPLAPVLTTRRLPLVGDCRLLTNTARRTWRKLPTLSHTDVLIGVFLIAITGLVVGINI